MNEVMEDNSHGMLIGCLGIFEIERACEIIAEGAPRGGEGSFMLIFRCNYDLIVARKAIHKR